MVSVNTLSAGSTPIKTKQARNNSPPDLHKETKLQDVKPTAVNSPKASNNLTDARVQSSPISFYQEKFNQLGKKPGGCPDCRDVRFKSHIRNYHLANSWDRTSRQEGTLNHRQWKVTERGKRIGLQKHDVPFSNGGVVLRINSAPVKDSCGKMSSSIVRSGERTSKVGKLFDKLTSSPAYDIVKVNDSHEYLIEELLNEGFIEKMSGAERRATQASAGIRAGVGRVVGGAGVINSLIWLPTKAISATAYGVTYAAGKAINLKGEAPDIKHDPNGMRGKPCHPLLDNW